MSDIEERVVQLTAALNLSQRNTDYVRQLLNVRTAFWESAEKECEDFMEALLNISEREIADGSPCWCMEETRRSVHADYCERARTLVFARRAERKGNENGD